MSVSGANSEKWQHSFWTSHHVDKLTSFKFTAKYVCRWTIETLIIINFVSVADTMRSHIGGSGEWLGMADEKKGVERKSRHVKALSATDGQWSSSTFKNSGQRWASTWLFTRSSPNSISVDDRMTTTNFANYRLPSLEVSGGGDLLWSRMPSFQHPSTTQSTHAPQSNWCPGQLVNSHMKLSIFKPHGNDSHTLLVCRSIFFQTIWVVSRAAGHTTTTHYTTGAGKMKGVDRVKFWIRIKRLHIFITVINIISLKNKIFADKKMRFGALMALHLIAATWSANQHKNVDKHKNKIKQTSEEGGRCGELTRTRKSKQT